MLEEEGEASLAGSRKRTSFSLLSLDEELCTSHMTERERERERERYEVKQLCVH